MKTPLLIAIDGPSASGKGTLAKNLAEHYGLSHLDTGAIYRLVAKQVLDFGYSPENKAAAAHCAQAMSEIFSLDMIDTPAIRTEDVSRVTSIIAAYPAVREHVFAIQRDFAYNADAGAVLDGRDIGTVILPDADAKFFVVADVEVRAKRRFEELSAKDLQSGAQSVTYEAVLEDMKRRDERDSARTLKADDAITLDTSQLDAQAALDKAIAFIDTKVKAA